jgi:hypothetical protein
VRRKGPSTRAVREPSSDEDDASGDESMPPADEGQRRRHSKNETMTALPLLEGDDDEGSEEPQEPPPAPPPMPMGDAVEELTEFEARFLSPRTLDSEFPDMVSFPSDLLHVASTPKIHRSLYATKPVPLPSPCLDVCTRWICAQERDTVCAFSRVRDRLVVTSSGGNPTREVRAACTGSLSRVLSELGRGHTPKHGLHEGSADRHAGHHLRPA